MGRADVGMLARKKEFPPHNGGRSPHRGVSTGRVKSGRPRYEIIVVVEYNII